MVGLSPQKLAQAWFRAKIASEKRAVAQKHLNRVLKDVKPGHLPFEKMFQGKKRLLVDAPELQGQFQGNRQIQNTLKELGHTEENAEIDLDKGTLTHEMETKVGPKKQQKKIPKLLSRAAKQKRRQFFDVAKKEGVDKKEAANLLSYLDRQGKIARDAKRRGKEVRSPIRNHVQANAPIVYQWAGPYTAPPEQYQPWTHDPSKPYRQGYSRLFEEHWKSFGDPNYWLTRGRETLDKQKEKRETYSKTANAEKAHRDLRYKIYHAEKPVKDTLSGAFGNLVKKMSDEEVDTLAKEITEIRGFRADDESKLKWVKKGLSTGYGHINDAVRGAKEYGKDIEKYPVLAKTLEQRMKDQDAIYRGYEWSKGGLYGDKIPSAKGFVDLMGEIEEKTRALKTERKKLPKEPSKESLNELAMARAEFEGMDVDTLYERARRTAEENAEIDSEYIDEWSESEEGEQAFQEALEEIFDELELEEPLGNLKIVDKNLELFEEELKELKQGLAELDPKQVKEWQKETENQVDALGEANQLVVDSKKEHGEAVSKQPPELRKALDGVETAEDLKKDYDEFLSTPSMKLLVTRDPTDVLRMSDHPNAHASITSCHSQGGSFYNCAIDEAQKGGAIAYLVSGKDAAKMDLESDDVLEDRDRSVSGAKPYGRIRLHRFTNKETGRELAIPAKRQYGVARKGFLDAVQRWTREEQEEAFDKSQEAKDFKLHGGAYLDGTAAALFKEFFSERPKPKPKPKVEEKAKEPEQPRVPERSEQPGPLERANPGDFWVWMDDTYKEVPNPNPDGRQKEITPSTLKQYSEGGRYQQQAIQLVQRYMQQYQQAQAQQV